MSHPKRTCPNFEAALQPLSYHAPQEIHSLMLRARFLHRISHASPRIEPRTTVRQADVLPTTLLRVSGSEVVVNQPCANNIVYLSKQLYKLTFI